MITKAKLTIYNKVKKPLKGTLTLSIVIAGVDAVAGQRDVLMCVLHGLQERDQTLVIRELFSYRKRDHHHVDGRVSLRQSSEQRRDGSVQLLHRALSGGRCVAVVFRVAHPCEDDNDVDKIKNTNFSREREITCV